MINKKYEKAEPTVVAENKIVYDFDNLLSFYKFYIKQAIENPYFQYRAWVDKQWLNTVNIGTFKDNYASSMFIENIALYLFSNHGELVDETYKMAEGFLYGKRNSKIEIIFSIIKKDSKIEILFQNARNSLFVGQPISNIEEICTHVISYIISTVDLLKELSEKFDGSDVVNIGIVERILYLELQKTNLICLR